jgi:hypothetical protein
MCLSITKVPKGYTISINIHFCKDCGYVGFTFLKHSLNLVFYAERIENDGE